MGASESTEGQEMRYFQDLRTRMGAAKDDRRYYAAKEKEHLLSPTIICRQYGHRFDSQGSCVCGATK
jgi:hypothetical protein